MQHTGLVNGSPRVRLDDASSKICAELTGLQMVWLPLESAKYDKIVLALADTFNIGFG